jgi:hypothetical protein
MSYDSAREEGMEEQGFEPEPMGNEKPRGEGGSDFELAIKLIRSIQESLATLAAVLEGSVGAAGNESLANLITSKRAMAKRMEDVSGARTVEGVFDGVSMVCGDGKCFAVPPNYASKSRLVEGDVLKLTIKPDGGFIFKQIGPIERRRIVGSIAFDATTHSFLVMHDGHAYKVLTASVTYFKGEPGDDAVILVPKSGKAVWGAVENVMKR